MRFGSATSPRNPAVSKRPDAAPLRSCAPRAAAGPEVLPPPGEASSASPELAGAPLRVAPPPGGGEGRHAPRRDAPRRDAPRAPRASAWRARARRGAAPARHPSDTIMVTTGLNAPSQSRHGTPVGGALQRRRRRGEGLSLGGGSPPEEEEEGKKNDGGVVVKVMMCGRRLCLLRNAETATSY